MSNIQPPFDYLATCTTMSLEAFELSRLNQAANLRKEMKETLEAWIAAESEARFARWLLEFRRRDNSAAGVSAAPRAAGAQDSDSQSLLPFVRRDRRPCLRSAQPRMPERGEAAGPAKPALRGESEPNAQLCQSIPDDESHDPKCSAQQNILAGRSRTVESKADFSGPASPAIAFGERGATDGALCKQECPVPSSPRRMPESAKWRLHAAMRPSDAPHRERDHGFGEPWHAPDRLTDDFASGFGRPEESASRDRDRPGRQFRIRFGRPDSHCEKIAAAS